MSTFKLLLFNTLKDNVLRGEEESVKDLVLERVLKDSKKIGLSVFIINLSSIILGLSSVLVIYTFFTYLSSQLKLSLLYSGGVGLCLSLTGIGVCFKYLKKRIIIYKNVEKIKANTKEFDWLSPLIDQIKIEQSKMKGR